MNELDVYVRPADKSDAPTTEPAPPTGEDAGWSAWQVAGAAWGVVALPTAVALSYTRNESVPWAVFHAIVATPYVIFRAVQWGLGAR